VEALNFYESVYMHKLLCKFDQYSVNNEITFKIENDEEKSFFDELSLHL